MGSVPVNDENLGVHRGGKRTSSSDDIFAIEQPTGRQSILRQTENLPNKTVPKGGKVCFQTPRRDPVSKRILSPSKSVKMDNLVECMKALDSLRLDSNTTPQKATETVAGQNNDDLSHPDDEMPIKSTGGYLLDFDNLDTMDPFSGSKKFALSPTRPSIEDLPLSPNQPEAAFQEAGEPESALDETLPFNRSVENSLAEVSSTESSVVTVMKNSCLEDQESSIATPDKQPPAAASLNVTQEDAPAAAPSAEDAPLHSRGVYSMDFDYLDAIDPFQTGSKIPDDVPLGQLLPAPSEASPLKTNPAPSETSPLKSNPAPSEASPLKTNPAPSETSPLKSNPAPSEASPLKTNPAPSETSPLKSNPAPSEAPPLKTNPAPPEASPLKTNPGPSEASPLKTNPGPSEASPLKTNPGPSEASPVKTNPAPPQASPVKTNQGPPQASPVKTNQGPPQASPVKTNPASPQASPVKTNPENIVEVQKEPSTTAEDNGISNDITKAPESEATVKPADPPIKVGSVKLEFNFDDGAEVKPKPQPKKFGKRPPTAKASGKKPTLEVRPAPPTKPCVADVGVEVDTPLPKATYSFDFDKLDDPNFNPFGASVKMDNPCGVKSSPAAKVSAVTEQLPAPAAAFPQLVTRAPSPCAAGLATNTEDGYVHVEIPQQEEPMSIPAPDLGLQREAVCRTPEPSDFGQQHDWTSQTLLVETNMEFVPGSTFIASDLDGQMDYLEQFGSANFKESVLRKQSLYLKFDPLMRESPKKAGAPTVSINPPRPAALASRLESERTVQQPPTMDDFKLIDVPAARIEVQNHTRLESLVPPTSTEEAIIDVLKYSQKDMDAAIARVRAEAKQTEALLTLKYDKLYEDHHELRKVFSGVEQTIPTMIADWKGQRERDRAQAQAKLNSALAEKEQVSQELSALDSSFSELFKRLEKYKVALGSYKKNEETLKGCAQEYLVRIRKEEQRYQTLKSYTEEKISKANEETGEVRSRLKAEVSGLQAQLRREQLKSQALESNYDQKVKEVVELTNLCDELIAKVQTG
ncbi:transforming acidic coiled-coil-containing protein 3 isoform X1 [Gadus morhua]|uniref:transforming acidic coiled-coil-containing protein 3 isoform X1 n=1 Tax=Gadus morhua TaxID=8049 RepID=UPI0011B59F34|nr:transforming acidic coiled-coil-containing protein 3 isoform X1 [Gadus morhua]